MKKQSRFLSLILRHDPSAGNLTLDPEGWASVSDVMRALREKIGPFTREQLQELVDTNDKQRFSFDQHGLRIRANQGHSLSDVDLKLEPVEPPALLYHGTKRKFLDAISVEGLKPGSRQHVHLSRDLDTARNVAGRRSGEDVILIVQAKELADKGHSFFQSANGVWLTDSVPVGYFQAFFEGVMDHLRSIVVSAKGATLDSAETHRVSAISNLENAIASGSYSASEVKRFHRLIHTMDCASAGTPQRKLENLQHVVVPALISMGLVEEI